VQRGGQVPIKIGSYRAVNYTLLKAIEKITGIEIIDTLEKVFDDTEGPTHNMLWDLGEAHLIDVKDTEYTHIITFLKTHFQKQNGGKTAIYVPGRIGYSIAKHQIKLANNLPVKIRAFRSYNEAVVWLTRPNNLIVIPSTN
jgi:hypothetical protein